MPKIVINSTNQLIFDLDDQSKNDGRSFSLLANSAEIVITAYRGINGRPGFVLQLDYENKTTGLMEFRALRCYNVQDISKNCTLVYLKNVKVMHCDSMQIFFWHEWMFEGESSEQRNPLEPFKI